VPWLSLLPQSSLPNLRAEVRSRCDWFTKVKSRENPRLIFQQQIGKLEQLCCKPAEEDPGGNADDKDEDTCAAGEMRSPEEPAEGDGHCHQCRDRLLDVSPMKRHLR
jgi:hypothetical protein